MVGENWPKNSYDRIWQTRYKSLLAYIQKHNRIPVKREVFEGFKLGGWVLTNRQAFFKKILDPKRQQKLAEVKHFFDEYKGGRRDDLWINRLKQLSKYKIKFGHWPEPNVLVSGFPLGAWLYRNRKLYYQKKLPENRLKMLLDLGYVFQPLKVIDKNWQDFFSYLKAYIEKYPENWNSERKIFPRSKRLRAWCKEMLKRHRSGSLRYGQRIKLKEIGFPFTQKITREARFLKQLKYYHSFKHIYPEKPITTFTEFPKGNALGRWCSYIRFRKNLLSSEQMKRLDELGFEWDPNRNSWLGTYNKLTTFINKFKRAPDLRNFLGPEEYDLAIWMQVQAKNFKKGLLNLTYWLKLKRIGIHDGNEA